MSEQHIDARLRDHLGRQRIDGSEQAALARVESFVGARGFVSQRGRGVEPRWVLAAALVAALVPGAIALALHERGSGSSPAGGVASPPPSPTATASGAPSPTPTATSTPAPTPAGPVVTAGAITALRMIDPGHGWALNGKSSNHAVVQVITTSDGGRTWHDVTPQQLALQAGGFSMAAADVRHAWVISGGSAFRTIDGGATWTGATLPQNIDGGELSAVDATTLYLVSTGHAAGSSDVTIVGSGDGGATWHVVSSSPTGAQPSQAGLPLACDKNGIGWRDARTGWATGTCFGTDTVFYGTHDGGVTWAHASLPAPAGGVRSGGGFTTFPPVFSSATTGAMVVVNGSDLYVYSTADGGGSWSAAKAPSGNGFLTPTRAGVVIGIDPDGSLAYSSDGGRSWTKAGLFKQLAGPGPGRQIVDAVDANTWFIVDRPAGSDATTLYVSPDAGQRLIRLQP